MELSKVYKIFTCVDGDWFVAAKSIHGEPIVIFEGHSREQAYEAILEDMGVKTPFIVKDMESGNYTPVREDFE
jgi:hypothetical protein